LSSSPWIIRLRKRVTPGVRARRDFTSGLAAGPRTQTGPNPA
jgi:hypothetical protein